jgi:hypothetical protein
MSNSAFEIDASYLAGTAVTAHSFIPNSSTVPTNGLYLSAANTVNIATNSGSRFAIGPTGLFGFNTGTSAAINMNIGGQITGATTSYGVYQGATVQSDVTATGYGFRTTLATQATSFTCASLVHYAASQGTIGSGSTVTAQAGFAALNTLTGAASNYGFRGSIAAAAGRYNLYMDGTAQNYIAGDMQFAKTVTAGGTVGAQTINKTTGTVNFAASATSLVVTNSLVAATSIIICTVGTNDATLTSVQAVAGSGSFTLHANAAATAETRVNFLVFN